MAGELRKLEVPWILLGDMNVTAWPGLALGVVSVPLTTRCLDFGFSATCWATSVEHLWGNADHAAVKYQFDWSIPEGFSGPPRVPLEQKTVSAACWQQVWEAVRADFDSALATGAVTHAWTILSDMAEAQWHGC